MSTTIHSLRVDEGNAVPVLQACSPDVVIFGPDYQQSLYCRVLCGLIFCEETQLVSSTFAHRIVHAFQTFELVWEELCADIRESCPLNSSHCPFNPSSNVHNTEAKS
ncbi:hypothetical protein Pint_21317 [Pistacia integerrima]|uniref:Uncharacterized protein n=1 Tax=Pistacia integerrima TaxID=434235 RepID=A0ACC0XBW7_9ROSI|nr:hypothetical protein Pint_21317 [Pistacia integerrima]